MTDHPFEVAIILSQAAAPLAPVMLTTAYVCVFVPSEVNKAFMAVADIIEFVGSFMLLADELCPVVPFNSTFLSELQLPITFVQLVTLAELNGGMVVNE